MSYSLESIKLLLATEVEGDQKAPFQLALHQDVGESATPFLGLLHFTLDNTLYCCYARKDQVPFLKSLVGCDLGLNPCLPDHWRTLYPLGQ